MNFLLQGVGKWVLLSDIPARKFSDESGKFSIHIWIPLKLYLGYLGLSHLQRLHRVTLFATFQVNFCSSWACPTFSRSSRSTTQCLTSRRCSETSRSTHCPFSTAASTGAWWWIHRRATLTTTNLPTWTRTPWWMCSSIEWPVTIG